ncbi:MAG: hypothetical protein CME88_12245 [Hirschia sp.]|nr:hypothetical protein [Hirschia sp.]MBF19139.1 hypothetical protein [Hirschia sp.]
MAKEQDPHSDEMIEGLGLDYPPEILARSASRRDLSSRMEFFAKQLQFLVGWAVFSIIAGIAGCAAGPNAVEAVIGSDAWAPLAPFDGLFRLGLLMLGGALVVLPYRLMAKDIRPRATLLWLRKFHRTDWRYFPIEKLLKSGRHQTVAPLTLRDRKITSDLESGSAIAAGLKFLRWTLGFFMGLFLVATITGSLMSLPTILENPDRNALLGILGTIVLFGLLFLIARLVWNSLRALEGGLGLARLTSNTNKSLKALDEFFDLVKEGKHPTGAIHVFKVADNNWQDVVRRAVERSDLIFMDISEATDQIAWEIQTIFHEKRAEQIILGFEQDENGKPRAESIAWLEGLVGADKVARAQHFDYPAHRKAFQPNEIQRLGEKLREHMLDALDSLPAKFWIR